MSPLEYRALTTAKVVIYDRMLAPTVARLLPLGGYAEPAPSGDMMDDAAWERALHFARDGWSVAKLVDTAAFSRQAKIGNIRRLTDRLLTFGSPSRLPVSVFFNLGGQVYEKTETDFGELGAILGVPSAEQSPRFTIIFDVADGGTAPRFSVASANGLAG